VSDMNIENHMVLDGPDAPWNQPDATDEEELSDEAKIDALEIQVAALTRRRDHLRASVRDFLSALDRGYFGAKVQSELDGSAFVTSLRNVSA
jgi:hypothetical protein